MKLKTHSAKHDQERKIQCETNNDFRQRFASYTWMSFKRRQCSRNSRSVLVRLVQTGKDRFLNHGRRFIWQTIPSLSKDNGNEVLNMGMDSAIMSKMRVSPWRHIWLYSQTREIDDDLRNSDGNLVNVVTSSKLCYLYNSPVDMYFLIDKKQSRDSVLKLVYLRQW